MNVSLSPELEDLVHPKMETGRYASANEVVREALHLMGERDQLDELHKDEIRQKIAAGLASSRAGSSTDGEAFFDSLMADLDASERRGPA